MSTYFDSFGKSSSGKAFKRSRVKARGYGENVYVPGTVTRFDSNLDVVWRIPTSQALYGRFGSSFSYFTNAPFSFLFGPQVQVWDPYVSICFPSQNQAYPAFVLRNLSDGTEYYTPTESARLGFATAMVHDPNGDWVVTVNENYLRMKPDFSQRWIYDYADNVIALAIQSNGYVGVSGWDSYAYMTWFDRNHSFASFNQIDFGCARNGLSGNYCGVSQMVIGVTTATEQLWMQDRNGEAIAFFLAWPAQDASGNTFAICGGTLPDGEIHVFGYDTSGNLTWDSGSLGTYNTYPSAGTLYYNGPAAVGVSGDTVVAMGPPVSGKNCWILNKADGSLIESKTLPLGVDVYSIDPDGSGGFVVGHAWVDE